MQCLHIPAHMTPALADRLTLREYAHSRPAVHLHGPHLWDPRLEMRVIGDYCQSDRQDEASRATGGNAFRTDRWFLSERDPIAKTEYEDSMPWTMKASSRVVRTAAPGSACRKVAWPMTGLRKMPQTSGPLRPLPEPRADK